jgi:hypothetical protein
MFFVDLVMSVAQHVVEVSPRTLQMREIRPSGPTSTLAEAIN